MHSIKPNTQIVEEDELTKYNTKSSLAVYTKLLKSGKFIGNKLVNGDRNTARSKWRKRSVPVPTSTTEKLNQTNTHIIVPHFMKTDTDAQQGVPVSKTVDAKLLIDNRPTLLSSISETIVLSLNETENSTIMPEVSEMELPSIARRNSFDSCITSVKENFGSSSEGFDNVQLFLHALLSFVEKAYPQMIQKLNGCESQEISFTFTCNLKSNPAPQPNNTIAIKTRTSVVEPDILPQKLDTDFIKFMLGPYNNHIVFKISLDKFLQDALSLLPIVSDMFNNSAVSVPSLHFAKWHFQNIAQGYLLRFVLKKSNVNTLNIMRNLYFIIITTNTVNLFLEVKFNLRNEIFMLEDIKPVNDFCEGTTVQDSTSMSSCGTDTFVNDFGAFGLDVYKNEPSISVYSDGEDTLSTSAFESILSTATSRCTIVTGRRCVATSTIFSFYIPPPHTQTIDKGAGDEPVFSICDKPKPKGWLFKPWVTKKYTVPTRHSMESTLNYVDETVFERMSYLHNKCITPEFREVFLKSLGHTLACTMLSLFISLL